MGYGGGKETGSLIERREEVVGRHIEGRRRLEAVRGGFGLYS